MDLDGVALLQSRRKTPRVLRNLDVVAEVGQVVGDDLGQRKIARATPREVKLRGIPLMVFFGDRSVSTSDVKVTGLGE